MKKNFCILPFCIMYISLLLINHTLKASCPPASVYECPMSEQCIMVPSSKIFIASIPNNCQPAEICIPAANIFVRQIGNFASFLPPVIFIHDIGSSADDWLCAAQAVCKNHNTYAIDLRGHGRSQQTDPNILPYTIGVFVNDLTSVLMQLNLSDIILVGHGLGGAIALAFIAQNPNIVARLVLIDSSPGLFTVPDCAQAPDCDPDTCANPFTCSTFCWPFNLPLSFFENFKTQFDQCVVACENVGEDPATCKQLCFESLVATEIIPLIYNEPCPAQLTSAQEALLNSYLRIGPDIYFNIVQNSLTADLRSLLSSITIPTLFVSGTNDLVVTYAPFVAQFMASKSSGTSFFANFIGKGHVPFITDFCRFNKLLNKFCRGFYNCRSITYPDIGCNVCPLLMPTDFAADACPDILNQCVTT